MLIRVLRWLSNWAAAFDEWVWDLEARDAHDRRRRENGER